MAQAERAGGVVVVVGVDQPVGMLQRNRSLRVALGDRQVDAELHAQFMGAIGDRLEAARELDGVGVPVADGARPAQVEHGHFHAQLGAAFEHGQLLRLVDLLAVLPRVVLHPRVAVVGDRRVDVGLGKALGDIARLVPVAVKEADKARSHLEGCAGLEHVVEVVHAAVEMGDVTGHPRPQPALAVELDTHDQAVTRARGAVRARRVAPTRTAAQAQLLVPL